MHVDLVRITEKTKLHYFLFPGTLNSRSNIRAQSNRIELLTTNPLFFLLSQGQMSLVTESWDFPSRYEVLSIQIFPF